jgi:hypothetical protein
MSDLAQTKAKAAAVTTEGAHRLRAAFGLRTGVASVRRIQTEVTESRQPEARQRITRAAAREAAGIVLRKTPPSTRRSLADHSSCLAFKAEVGGLRST